MHQIEPSLTPASGNFADLVLRHARLQPWTTALVQPTDNGPHSLGFGELAAAIEGFRAGVRQRGWQPGDAVVVMHAPCIALYIAVLGLLAEGMVPVFIDTGMGPRKMLQALRHSGARRIITSPRLQRLGGLLLPRRVEWLALETLVPEAWAPASAAPIAPSPALHRSDTDHGLVSYTSGTTGRPKGADRTHASLIAQHQAIRAHWPDRPADIDMTCLPVLVLHNLCCGMPSILPDMDFAHPGRADGERILEQIRRHGITRLSGAPAFLEQLAAAASKMGGETGIQAIRVGGAPVSAKRAARLQAGFPRADLAVVYGSTEAEPIAHLDARELLADSGPGYPVGRPVPQTALKLIDAVGDSSDEGEVWVAGDHVLQRYYDDPAATRESKIPRPEGGVWHRTGDLARRDADGRLRLLGRLRDRLTWQGRDWPLFVLERALEESTGVDRAAIVQRRPGSRPHAFLTLEAGADAGATLHNAALLLAREGLTGCPCHHLKKMPLDSRHNSKVQRQPLRRRCF